MGESTTGSFSLMGGPLYQLGRRLGLVREETNTVLIGLTLGPGLWLVIVTLAVIEGVTDQLFNMSLVAAHARLLVVIPLFFVCESWVDPRTTGFVATIARTGVVPPGAHLALDTAAAGTTRAASGWWPEALCLLASVAMGVTGATFQTYGVSAAADPSRTALAALVYYQVGLTVFRFLVFRGVWKLALWGWFLWRVSRLDLRLIPGHADRAGGLGPVEAVHERFTPLIAALSVIECASLAESISAGTLSVTAVYPTLAALLLVDAVLFLAPLLVFTDRLWASRSQGVGAYMDLSARYAKEFEAKWTSGSTPPNETLLGSADLQSLADLTSAIDNVKSMRWITVGPRLLTMMTLAAAAPLAPLLLFQYPLAELAEKFFTGILAL